MFAFPHGIHVDNEGNVWVTDPAGGRERGGRQCWSAGHQVQSERRSAPEAGQALVTGKGHRTRSAHLPTSSSAERRHLRGRRTRTGHERAHHEVRSERQVHQGVGSPGFGPCGTNQFSRLHALEIDSRGRLFVGDRDNNRIQIFDQDGNYLDAGNSSAARAGSTSTPTTTSTWPTPNRARRPTRAATRRTRKARHPCRKRQGRFGEVFRPGSRPAGGTSAAEGVAATRTGRHLRRRSRAAVVSFATTDIRIAPAFRASE